MSPRKRKPQNGPVTSSYVFAAARTPFGRFGGALAGVRPDDLAAVALEAVLRKVPHFDPASLGDVVWGCANQAGEDNRNVGRMAVLLAGLPVSVTGHDREPPVRVQPRRRHDGVAHRGVRRRRRGGGRWASSR